MLLLIFSSSRFLLITCILLYYLLAFTWLRPSLDSSVLFSNSQRHIYFLIYRVLSIRKINSSVWVEFTITFSSFSLTPYLFYMKFYINIFYDLLILPEFINYNYQGSNKWSHNFFSGYTATIFENIIHNQQREFILKVIS